VCGQRLAYCLCDTRPWTVASPKRHINPNSGCRQQPALHLDVAGEIGHRAGPLNLAFLQHIDPVADDLGAVLDWDTGCKNSRSSTPYPGCSFVRLRLSNYRIVSHLSAPRGCKEHSP
jgi:hypothetical protein